jgi:hypothetical protein
MQRPIIAINTGMNTWEYARERRCRWIVFKAQQPRIGTQACESTLSRPFISRIGHNKLFRYKNRFYLDLFRSFAKRVPEAPWKAQEEAVNYAMDCNAMNCFGCMTPSSEKYINAERYTSLSNQVRKNRSQLSLSLDRW